MAQPVFYQTLNMLGIDPTIYYTNITTAGGSVTPELPAPPFVPGTRAFGSDGSEFIFVQASTSISLSDFVLLTAGTAVNPYMANSITTTNATQTAATVGNANMAIASSGLVVKQSVSFIPAGAMFWALTKGQFVPCSQSASFATLAPSASVILYTTTSAGMLTTAPSVSSSTLASVAFAGFNLISSISVSIPSSVVPQVGIQSATGFTIGPVVSMNNPRTFVSTSALAGTPLSGQVFW